MVLIGSSAPLAAFNEPIFKAQASAKVQKARAFMDLI
jgi:hypothetical protein